MKQTMNTDDEADERDHFNHLVWARVLEERVIPDEHYNENKPYHTSE
jgi:hypothetical protein